MDDSKFSTNLEYYKAFYFAAETNSITAAADALYLSQPTVSNSIHRLEEQLDAKLFIRGKKGVGLTSEGEVLLARIAPAMRLILSGEKELRELKNLEGGTLSIVSTEMGFESHVFPAIDRFHADFPNVKIVFRNALTEEALNMIRGREIDFAVLHSPVSLGTEFHSRVISTLADSFVVGEKYSFLAEKTRTLNELLEYPMVSMPEGTASREYTETVFRQYGYDFEPDFVVTTISLMVEAVKRNFGICMLPTEYIGEDFEKTAIYKIPVDVELAKRQTLVITSKNITPSPSAKVFVEKYLLN